MNRKLHRAFICCLLLTVGATSICVASNTGLALTLDNYSVQNTGDVNLGYTITINASLTNTDAVPFIGNLDFGLRNNQQGLTGVPDIFSKPRYSGKPLELQPGETVPAIFSVDVQTPYFAPGPDVVVVWPISTSPIADSVVISFTINAPNQINTNVADDDANGFSFWVADDRIVLKSSSIENVVKQVRIYNVQGSIISATTGGTITEIPLSGNLPKGIYMCELITADNTRRVFKFSH